jgi:dolichol-phosphate mannosyltransferase
VRCFIVLPCFNEEVNIKQLVHSLDEVLRRKIPYRIIAVNDGSRDRTGEFLKDLSTDYPVEIVEHPANLGLGAALRTGLLAASEEAFDDDVVVTMDSDNTHDPKDVLGMLDAIVKADVVVGSRYAEGGVQLNVPVHRVLLSRMINLMVSKVFQLPSRDNTSGFRCFRVSLLKRIYGVFGDRIIESDGFVSSLELLLKAVYSGGVVTEVPILLDYGKKGGSSKMRLFSTVFTYLALLLRHKWLNGLKRFD